MAKIALVEPFFGGSHKQWAESIRRFSKHQIQIVSLPARHWKWRMRAASIPLSQQISTDVDLIFCSDMIDLALFKSLLSDQLKSIPLLLYFHENQLSYPWSNRKKEWDRNYAWINYCSCLVADQVVFNSDFNKASFLEALPQFLSQFPDFKNVDNVSVIRQKSLVLPVGIDYSEFDLFKSDDNNNKPTLLWNHRWEFDKNPKLFFNTLFELKAKGKEFDLIVMGEQYSKHPAIFDEAKKLLSAQIQVWGHIENREQYIRNLWKADILPVTSIHDFFGVSVLEAIYCNTTPLLPHKLAYPEHLNSAEYFYHSESDFVGKLTKLIENVNPTSHELQSQILKYDWSQVILQYDDLFARFCS